MILRCPFVVKNTKLIWETIHFMGGGCQRGCIMYMLEHVSMYKRVFQKKKHFVSSKTNWRNLPIIEVSYKESGPSLFAFLPVSAPCCLRLWSTSSELFCLLLSLGLFWDFMSFEILCDLSDLSHHSNNSHQSHLGINAQSCYWGP